MIASNIIGHYYPISRIEEMELHIGDLLPTNMIMRKCIILEVSYEEVTLVLMLEIDSSRN